MSVAEHETMQNELDEMKEKSIQLDFQKKLGLELGVKDVISTSEVQ